MEKIKSGFVSLMGPTNSGKSSLLNALIGAKVSIVSPKVQTTYHRICGIVNDSESQIVFVDTPGFQRYPENVARLLNKVAERGGSGSDFFLWLFDVSSPRVGSQCRSLRDRIARAGKKESTFCVLNKIDLLPNKDLLLPIIKSMGDQGLFAEIIPISVTKKDGLDRLMQIIRSRLPEGPRYFEEGNLTDRSEQFLVSEFIRESAYYFLQQELPYSIRVEIESWESDQQKGKVPVIGAVIHVDSNSRKGILIGQKGGMLKKIGIHARKQIEALLGHQVCLKLYVNVVEEWTRDSRCLNQYLELSGGK